jgi:hypothetical protein
MQALVLRSWWKQSQRRQEGSFADYCLTLPGKPLVPHPRWILQEYAGAHLTKPGPEGGRPGALRIALRCLLVPWFSLWLNFKGGVQALLCTYLLTGWGLLLFSWEFGWLNSFVKGYEQAAIGPVTGLLGILLLIAGLFYVPMAQVHQAVTGDPRAFFDFRFVWRVIQERPLSYVGLAGFVTLASLPLEVLKSAPLFFDGHLDLWTNASDAEVLRMLRTYSVGCCAVLFPTLLLVRLGAALLYRSAVLQMFRDRSIGARDLHPVLCHWLADLGWNASYSGSAPVDRFGIGSAAWWLVGCADTAVLFAALAASIAAGPGAALAIVVGWVLLALMLGPLFLIKRNSLTSYLRFNGRRIIFGTLFTIWFVFVAKVYVGEFLNRHPAEGISPDPGFMNHVLIQFPRFDLVPKHLQDLANP